MIFFMALLGWGLGILVNFLADCLPRYRTLRRFHCASCTAPRPPWAWSGIIAWLTNHRRCGYCGMSLSKRAPLVELVLLTGAILIALRDGGLSSLFPDLFVLFVFALITVIDIEHRLILHVVSGPAALVIGLMRSLDSNQGPTKTLLGGLAGFGSFLLLYFLGQLFAIGMSKLRGSEIEEVAFGFGDVTLAGLIGLTVGWTGVIVALVLGVLLAGVFSLLFIIARLFRRRYTPFMPIPYGPFLILGAMLVYYGIFQAIVQRG
jgi:leader peptidase (prepilin peptidase)/N-methyltransferase